MARRWEQKIPQQMVPGVTDYQAWLRQWQERQGRQQQGRAQPEREGGGFGAYGASQPGASGWTSAQATVPNFAPPMDYQQQAQSDTTMTEGRQLTPDQRAAWQPGGGLQDPRGFRVNVPSGYGKPNAYYYNGHAVQGDQGQWITLPVAYNEAADTRRWEYNGTPQESTMRRAVRYAYDDVRDGRAKDFNAALMARLKQFHDEAGGKDVGYTLGGQQGQMDEGQQLTPAQRDAYTPPANGQVPDTTTQQATQQTQTYTNPITGQATAGSGNQFARDLILASDEDARDDYLLRQLGIDPNNGGLYLDTILRTLNPIATRYTQLQGIGGGGGGPMINTQGNLNTLAGWLRGGDGLQAVQNWARQQMQGATGQGSMLRNLSDANAQQNTLGQLLALETAGVNPILVQAYADYFNQGRRAYRDYNFNQIGQGAIQNPIDWLLGSQWADLLR